MAGLSIADLPLPDDHYRPDLSTRRLDGVINFEQIDAAYIEDKQRACLLSATAVGQNESLLQQETIDLAKRLLRNSRGDTLSATLASASYVREPRIKVAGAVWKLHEDNPDVPVATVTLIPRGLKVPSSKLLKVDPRIICNAVKSDLNRAGGKEADGWFIGFIHGENDPGTDTDVPHMHGMVGGGMIDVVDRLRHQPKYASHRPKGSDVGEPLCQRVRISRGPLTNLPDPITYILQSYWPARWSGDVGGGSVKRTRRKHRIPEPHHTEVLLWLDQWKLSDLCILVGLRVTKTGLKATKSTANTYSNGTTK
ncbi:MAG: hypothetical protein JWO15_1579 [Sphingomonadales bacterium]|nr:hypothetical protein [Sphingomonadales bacterium]